MFVRITIALLKKEGVTTASASTSSNEIPESAMFIIAPVSRKGFRKTVVFSFFDLDHNKIKDNLYIFLKPAYIYQSIFA